jgi:hypothetical protein
MTRRRYHHHDVEGAEQACQGAVRDTEGASRRAVWRVECWVGDRPGPPIFDFVREDIPYYR